MFGQWVDALSHAWFGQVASNGSGSLQLTWSANSGTNRVSMFVMDSFGVRLRHVHSEVFAVCKITSEDGPAFCECKHMYK